MNFSDPFLLTLFGTLVGGVISAAIASYFARQSRKDMQGVWRLFARQTSQELHTVWESFARIAEEQGLVEWVRDADGRITSARIISQRLQDEYRLRVDSKIGVDKIPYDTLQSGPASMHGDGTVDSKPKA